MLKRTPSLTDQAKQYIKQQILSDAFEDDRIPSENDLAEALGVSRTTIRDALSRLENEGVVFRKQGAGTFVNRPGLRIKSRLEEIWSYEAVLRQHGYTPSTHILDVATEPSSTDIADELNLVPGDPLLVVQKLFLEDEQPVILARNIIPRALIAKPFENDAFLAPVFSFLAQYGQQHLAYYVSEVVPLLASDDVARILGLKKPSAIVSLDEIGYNEDNAPILKAVSYFRDDLLRLRFIRRRA